MAIIKLIPDLVRILGGERRGGDSEGLSSSAARVEVQRAGISVKSGSQRQLSAEDDSLKMRLWRLHARVAERDFEVRELTLDRQLSVSMETT